MKLEQGVSNKQILEWIIANDRFVAQNLEKSGLLTSEGLRDTQVDSLASYVREYYGAHWRSAVRELSEVNE